MSDLVLHNVSDELLAALHARADQNHRTMDQEAISLLRESLKSSRGHIGVRAAKLASLAGAWEDSRSAEEIIGSIRDSRN